MISPVLYEKGRDLNLGTNLEVEKSDDFIRTCAEYYPSKALSWLNRIATLDYLNRRG